jgi:hypothetical protein
VSRIGARKQLIHRRVATGSRFRVVKTCVPAWVVKQLSCLRLAQKSHSIQDVICCPPNFQDFGFGISEEGTEPLSNGDHLDGCIIKGSIVYAFVAFPEKDLGGAREMVFDLVKLTRGNESSELHADGRIGLIVSIEAD